MILQCHRLVKLGIQSKTYQLKDGRSHDIQHLLLKFPGKYV